MESVVREIGKELKEHVDPVYREQSYDFFKEDVRILGVRSPIVRKISSKYFKKVKCLGKERVFSFCEELLKGESEFQTIGLDWLFRLRKEYTEDDFKFFEMLLERYVSNWASCDDFCTHGFGEMVLKYPGFLPRLKMWAGSKNRWLRRASAVVLIPSVRRSEHLEEALAIADILLEDKDDLVQKGYGWMLKEASNVYQKDVFKFVMERKSRMPRTALRYAIEKMPEGMKKMVMEG